ncbi:unnamed protein product, partial [Effrenium voratum]
QNNMPGRTDGTPTAAGGSFQLQQSNGQHGLENARSSLPGLKSGGLLLQGSHRGCRRHQDSPETGGLYRPGQGAKALDRAGLKDGPEICRFAPAIMLLLLAVHKMEVWLWPCQLHCSRGRSEEKSLHARPNDEFALQLRARMQQD